MSPSLFHGVLGSRHHGIVLSPRIQPRGDGMPLASRDVGATR